MRIVIQFLEPSIERMLREVLAMEGYTALATPDVEVALRALAAHEGHSLLLMDNYHASPAARAAFARLAASPELRQRVRVIGLATLEYPGLSGLALDAFVAIPFTVRTLLEAVEAQLGAPDAVRPAAPGGAGDARDRRDGARCGGHGGDGGRTRRRSQRRRRRSRVRRSRKS